MAADFSWFFETGARMNDWSSTRSGSEARVAPRWKALRVCASLATLFSLTGFAQWGTPNTGSSGQFRPDKVNAVTPVNERPDANKLAEINSKRAQQQNFAAANAERKRQLTEDATRLLRIAADFNEELSQAGGGTFTAATLAKAGAIEQLAHAVREKMKLTVAAP